MGKLSVLALILSLNACCLSSAANSSLSLEFTPPPHANCVSVQEHRAQVLPRGVLSLTYDFQADPTGRTDSSAAIQAALIAARVRNMTLMVPQGCYAVTKTLVASEPRNGRWQPTAVVGEVSESTKRRPTFFVPPSTPAFSGATKQSVPVFLFVTNWCLEPGLGISVPAKGCTSSDLQQGIWESSAYQFNQVLQSVDIIIEPGNPTAVGVDMNGAQGNTLEDVTVFAADDTLAGFAGGNGGGGSFKGVKVVGGKFGIDMTFTGDAPTYVGVTLINQSCASIVANSRSTPIITGLRIFGSPRISAVISGVNPTGYGPDCDLPTPPFKARLSPQNSLHGAVSIVDAVIEVHGNTTCVRSNSSLYFSDVYTAGCNIVVLPDKHPQVPAVRGAQFTYFSILGMGKVPQPQPAGSYTYAFPSYIEGKRQDIVVRKSGQNNVPSDLQNKHLWTPDSSPTFLSPGAVNALDLGVKGDGVSDDWDALQNVVNSNPIVYLPKGFYRISKPLVLKNPNSALVGVGRTLSILMPMRNSSLSAGELPVLDIQGTNINIGMITVVTWDDLPGFAVNWAGTGRWRQSFFNRVTESTFPPFSAAPRITPKPRNGRAIGRPLFVLSGGGSFYDFNLDFGCCFGTLLPPPSIPVPPDIASSSEVLLQLPSYRSLLINHSSAGCRFYPLNMEQDFGEAHTEISHSSNITFYGAKSENNYVAVWVHDSDSVTLHGYGGNASPFQNKTSNNIRQDGRIAQYMPSLFRIQRSTRVRLANLIDAGRITSPTHPSTFISAGNGTDPRVWNMVLQQDGDELCDPDVTPTECQSSAVLDRPVIWEWTGSSN